MPSSRLVLAFLLLAPAACGGSGSAADEPADAASPSENGDGNDASSMPGDAAGSYADAGGDGDDAGIGAEDAGRPDPLACNGHVELCERPFDEVVFPATHNAHAAQEYGYSVVNANQISGLATQLDDGIRCLLMDVYDDNGESVLCHGPCALASTSHVEGLAILESFLRTHPREVVSIIYQDDLSAERIAADFATVGLDAYVYVHETGTPWPTLGEMIDANTRLVVTAENGRPPPAWFHHVWDEAWDTPYDFKSESEFSCDLNRGSRDNPLFLVNHWLGTAIGLPSEDGAKTVNAYDVLYTRAKGCWDETLDVPNFIAVDFYEHGDLFEVVDTLNGF